MRVLYIAYPLLAVTPESAGGAEQVLGSVEAEMSRRGHQTVLAAADGSQCAGELIATGEPAGGLDELERREEEQWKAVHAVLQSREFDVIHDHSGSFWRRAGELTAPVLATLHLPPRLYPADAFASVPPNVLFNCVSRSQAASFPDLGRLLGVVPNGIDAAHFLHSGEKDDFVLWLGRICEEKGPHLAIAAAAEAGVGLVLAGQVYPFRYHHDFAQRAVAPFLDGQAVAYVRQPSREQKLALLRRARAVLIPSLVDETSSLVALEAMACGTPVIAFRRGALPEMVEHGKTGFVVDSVEEMAAAIARAGEILPQACRAEVIRNHSFAATADGYERLYAQLVEQARAEAGAQLAARFDCSRPASMAICSSLARVSFFIGTSGRR
jgi:glycosyltransferase involved in cell wall biosynthesis